MRRVLFLAMVILGCRASRVIPAPATKSAILLDSHDSCASHTLGAPVTITEIQNSCGGGDFAVDRGFIYWSPDCMSIARCERRTCAGGPQTVIADEGVRAIASDGTTLFWVHPQGNVWSIHSCPLDDCSPGKRKKIFDAGVANYLAVHGDDLYFPQSNVVRACKKDACAATVHDTSLTTKGWAVIGVDDRTLYACDWGTKSVRFVPTSSDVAAPKEIPGSECSAMVVDESDVYLWRGYHRTKRIAKPGCCTELGGCVTDLALNVVAVDSSDVFLIETEPRRAFVRRPKLK